MLSGMLCGTAWSGPGAILSHSKINSDTLAAFGVPLDDGDEFSDSVAGLGDLDGPGPAVAALAVGAVGDDDGGPHHGAVYVLFLNGAGHVLSQRKISDTEGNFTAALDDYDEFGGSLAYLGDLDGPGPSVAAMAVGAVGDGDGGPGRGAVYVLLLDAGGGVLSHQKISSTEGSFTGALDDDDEFGGAVAGLGDLDGAGPSVAALAVGVIGDDDGGLDRGATYILFLSSSGGVLSHQKVSNTEGNFAASFHNSDNFGEDLAGVGDLDGPGPAAGTLVVSAIKQDDGGNDRGAAYVLFLASTGTVLSYGRISNTQGNFTGALENDDNFGTAVVALGDLDGTGPSVATVAISAGSDDGAGLDRGAIYILFLDATGNVLSYQEHSSTAGYFTGQLGEQNEFGSALAALGDIDGPGGGAQTLVSGVGYDDDGGVDRGASYLLFLDGRTGVAAVDPPDGPRGIGVGAISPNPFNRGTSISFRTDEAGLIRINISDVGGRVVRRLAGGQASPGERLVAWDGRDDSGRALAAGTYFLTVSVNGRTVIGGAKAVLLR